MRWHSRRRRRSHIAIPVTVALAFEIFFRETRDPRCRWCEQGADGGHVKSGHNCRPAGAALPWIVPRSTTVHAINEGWQSVVTQMSSPSPAPRSPKFGDPESGCAGDDPPSRTPATPTGLREPWPDQMIASAIAQPASFVKRHEIGRDCPRGPMQPVAVINGDGADDNQ